MDKLSDEQLDQLLAGIQTPGQVDALYSKLLQRVINRSLDAEMDVHLGYSANEKSSSGRRGNSRNGKTSKTVKGTFGEVEIETPRDRDGSFQPQLVPKRQVRLDGCVFRRKRPAFRLKATGVRRGPRSLWRTS